MVLVIDNYDSFVHNLARYIRRLGLETTVVRNDAIDCERIRSWTPQAIVMSPGPRTPATAGVCLDAVRELGDQVPMLGICLGHQAIVEALGGAIIRSNVPVHGRSSDIEHDQLGVFKSLPTPLQVGRYHSLVADEETLPDCLKVTARTRDQTVMAVQHRSLPVVGLQFHPESILTPTGLQMLDNFFQVVVE